MACRPAGGGTAGRVPCPPSCCTTRCNEAAPVQLAPSPSAAVARSAFGDEVVEHYLNNARVELAAFNSCVTDWERVRGFERF